MRKKCTQVMNPTHLSGYQRELARVIETSYSSVDHKSGLTTFRNLWCLWGPSFLGFTSLHLQKVLSLCLHQDSRLMGPFDLKFRDKDSILKKKNFSDLSKIHIA